MNLNGFVTWHHYDVNGKIINYSTEDFSGTKEKLKEVRDREIEPNKRKVANNEGIILFAGFQLLSYARD